MLHSSLWGWLADMPAAAIGAVWTAAGALLGGLLGGLAGGWIMAAWGS